MYNSFISTLNRLSNISNDAILKLSIIMLVLIFVYLAVWTVFLKMNGLKQSYCKSQFRSHRRWLFIVAWAFAIYTFMVLTRNIPIGFNTGSQLILPALFLLVVYIMEAIYRLINKSTCCLPAEKKEIEIKNETKPAVKTEVKSVIIPKQRKPRVSPQGATATKAVEPLGVKIERQRKQAEQKNNAATKVSTPYTAQTREVLAKTDEAIASMDDLQRKIDALRNANTTNK